MICFSWGEKKSQNKKEGPTRRSKKNWLDFFIRDDPQKNFGLKKQKKMAYAISQRNARRLRQEREAEMEREYACPEPELHESLRQLLCDYGNVFWGVRNERKVRTGQRNGRNERVEEVWPCVVVTRPEQCDAPYEALRAVKRRNACDNKGSNPILVAWIEGFAPRLDGGVYAAADAIEAGEAEAEREGTIYTPPPHLSLAPPVVCAPKPWRYADDPNGNPDDFYVYDEDTENGYPRAKRRRCSSTSSPSSSSSTTSVSAAAAAPLRYWTYAYVRESTLEPFDTQSYDDLAHVAPATLTPERRRDFWRAVRRASLIVHEQAVLNYDRRTAAKAGVECVRYGHLPIACKTTVPHSLPSLRGGERIQYRVGQSDWIEGTIVRFRKTRRDGHVERAYTDRGHILYKSDFVRIISDVYPPLPTPLDFCAVFPREYSAQGAPRAPRPIPPEILERFMNE